MRTSQSFGAVRTTTVRRRATRGASGQRCRRHRFPMGQCVYARPVEPVLVGVRRGGRARRHAELGEDVGDVASHRLLADHQLGGDRPVGHPGRHQAQHLQLPSAQPGLVGGSTARRWLHRREVGQRPELLEDAGGGVELERRAVFVAELSAGEADRDADARRLVRSVQVRAMSPTPAAARRAPLGRRLRRAGPAPSRGPTSRSRSGACSSVSMATSSSLAAPRGIDVAGRQHDLDVGRQQWGPRHEVGGLVERRGGSPMRRPPADLAPAAASPGPVAGRVPSRSPPGSASSASAKSPRSRRNSATRYHALPMAGWPGRARRAARRPARASSIALVHAPSSCRISARCTRHWPRYGTRSGCESHHRESAAVHSLRATDIERELAHLDHRAIGQPGDDR